MNIGSLNARIDLLKPLEEDDEWGGRKTLWNYQGRAWAHVFQADYAEQEATGTPMSREQLRLKIRCRKDIKRGWLIRYQKEEYLVQDVDNTYKDSTTLIVRRYEPGM